jgi:hypothetical protein
MDKGFGPSTPLLIYQPFNLAVLLTFYSPIIVALSVFSMSFIFQNFKGIIYLLWLIVFTWFRSLGFELTGGKPMESKGNLCTMVQYSKYGNATFSMFFIAFTFVYICGPMILNKDVNYWVLSAFLFYMFLDIGIHVKMGCTTYTYVFLDVILGIVSGIIALTSMYGAKLYNYIFFNESSSTKDVCSMPTKQTFKCKLYKNGELVGSTNA